jgi:hypothetical protein
MKTITICTSASFYRQAIEVADRLEPAGLHVSLPHTATKMKASGDFDVSHYKTWYDDVADYHKKAQLMRRHFDEVAAGDAVLVLNYDKHGVPNYIGGNVLMEMALAFYLKKPIYIMNDAPADSPFLEEILGMTPVLLRGKLDQLIAEMTVSK